MSRRQSPLDKPTNKKDNQFPISNCLSSTHWSTRIKDSTVAARSPQPYLDLPVWGGCDYGKFCHLGTLKQEEISYWSGASLQDNDILLEIQGHEVSGYTLIDLRKLIRLFSSNSEPIVLKTISLDILPFPDDLKQFLALSFPQDSPDYALQCLVKNNINQRVVPCTTRKKRSDEVDGVDYQFLSKEEFERREKSGLLLESGSYEGNRYGTPMPLHDTSIIPGDVDQMSQLFHKMSSSSSAAAAATDQNNAAAAANLLNQQDVNLIEEVPDPNPHLGPLPTHWEIAYTDEGQVYFINHAQGTTQWEDPRMPIFDNPPMSEDNNVGGFDDDDDDVQILMDNGAGGLVSINDRQEFNIPDGSSEDLPPGWERVVDPKYGVFYIDHINQHTQYEKPVANNNNNNNNANDSLTGGVVGGGGATLGGVNNSYYPHFTPNPHELKGNLVKTTLIKSPRGFGFTIIGGSDRESPQFLQIKSIVNDGPAAQDGFLMCGDVLAYVNDLCVLGFTHSDVVQLFQKISVGDAVTLTVSQGYRLPYEPNDPDMQFVTTLAVQSPDEKLTNLNDDHVVAGTVALDVGGGGTINVVTQNRFGTFDENQGVVLNSGGGGGGTTMLPSSTIMLHSPGHSSAGTGSGSGGQQQHTSTGGGGGNSYNFFPRDQKLEFLKVNILKSSTGFGFTIADHLQGQKVKEILDIKRCANLRQGDVLVEINDRRVKEMPHSEVVQILKECPVGLEARLLIQRGGTIMTFGQMDRSNSTTAAPLLSSMNVTKNAGMVVGTGTSEQISKLTVDALSTHTSRSYAILPMSKSMEWLQQSHEGLTSVPIPITHEPPPTSFLHQEDADDDNSSSPSYALPQKYRSKTPGPDWGRGNDSAAGLLNDIYTGLRISADNNNHIDNSSSIWLRDAARRPKTPTADHMRQWNTHNYDSSIHPLIPTSTITNNNNAAAVPNFIPQSQQQQHTNASYQMPLSTWLQRPGPVPNSYGSLPRPSRHRYQAAAAAREEAVSSRRVDHSSNYAMGMNLASANTDISVLDFNVTLQRQQTGFGFRILGGAEERSQVTVGPLVPNGAAELSGQMRQGDEIISVDGTSVLGSPHRHVVGLMDLAGRVYASSIVPAVSSNSFQLPLSLAAAPVVNNLNSVLTSSQSIYQMKQQQSDKQWHWFNLSSLNNFNSK